MFNLGALGAAVTLDSSMYLNALNALTGQTKAVFSKLAGIAAAYVGFRTLTGAVETSIKAFITQEDAVDGLERALANRGAVQYAEQLQKLAGDLQQVTTYGDEATMATMALGINMGLPAAKMEEATKAAMGLAAANKLDLTTSMQLVAKAYAGNTGALSRYGIKIDTTKSKQEQFAQVLEQGKKAFPLAEAQTTGQKLQQMANAWGDLMEQVGQFIAKLFGVKDASQTATKMIADMTKKFEDNMDLWVKEVKKFYTYVEEYTKMAVAVVEPVITYLYECFMAGCRNVYNIIAWTVENGGKIWANFGTVATAVWEDIKLTVDNVFELLRINLISQFTMYSEIVASFGRNWRSIFTDLWEVCKRTLASIGAYFTSTIENIGKMAASLGKNFWDLVTGKKSFSKALGGIIDDYAAAVENTARQVQKQWEGFEFGSGTKQFAKDVAGAYEAHLGRLGDQAIKIVADVGRNTEAALSKIGTSAFPEMQSGNFGAMIDKYKRLGNTLGDIAEASARKRQQLEEDYAKRVGKTKRNNSGQNIGPEAAAGKNDVAGSFSAAVLNAMLGAGSPEKETAKNTREMVRLQRQQLEKGTTAAETYA